MVPSESKAHRPDSDTEVAEPTLAGAFAPDGVDLTVIRWMLDLSPAERLEVAQDLLDAAAVVRPSSTGR